MRMVYSYLVTPDSKTTEWMASIARHDVVSIEMDSHTVRAMYFNSRYGLSGEEYSQ